MVAFPCPRALCRVKVFEFLHGSPDLWHLRPNLSLRNVHFHDQWNTWVKNQLQTPLTIRALNSVLSAWQWSSVKTLLALCERSSSSSLHLSCSQQARQNSIASRKENTRECTYQVHWKSGHLSPESLNVIFILLQTGFNSCKPVTEPLLTKSCHAVTLSVGTHAYNIAKLSCPYSDDDSKETPSSLLLLILGKFGQIWSKPGQTHSRHSFSVDAARTTA